MDFFQAQALSRRNTRRLVLMYLLATVAVAAAVTAILGTGLWWFDRTSLNTGPNWLAYRSSSLAAIATGVIVFIGIASLFRILVLREGGSRIARELGGTQVPPDTQDPLRRRLRNVVEEMSIASGLPVPEIFVLEREPGINAFAAGYGPEDAAVAVTRGTLEELTRDELQGVIAHEFSHILNGDMRLNIRLMGPLFGITVIGLIGRSLIRNSRFSGRSRSRGGGVIFLALGLAVVGYTGVLLARLIKAGVSRQREYLADAYAVQFTRQADGISGALKKILSLSTHSYLQRAEAEEISHMLFARGGRLTSLFATHPPLPKRIRRLDPAWQARPPSPEDDAGASVAGAALPGEISAFALAAAAPAELAGNPGPAELAAAHTLHRHLPSALYDAAHSNQGALLLIPALVLHPDAIPRREQLAYLQSQLGAARAAAIEDLFNSVVAAGPAYRLPLLDLSFPALRNRPDAQLQYLSELVHTLVHADGRVELFEYALARVLGTAVQRARQPAARIRKRERLSVADHGESLQLLFAALAVHGHAEAGNARSAWAAGLARLDPALAEWQSGELPLTPGSSGWQKKLDLALDQLQKIEPGDRRKIIEALTVTALHDNQITVAESELLRVACATLDCPLPPLYAGWARRVRESDSEPLRDSD